MAEQGCRPHHVIPPTLRIVCKDGKRWPVEAYDQILSVVSPLLADMISKARSEAAEAASQTPASAGKVKRMSTPDGTPLRDQAAAMNPSIVQLWCLEDLAQDWQQIVDILHPAKRVSPAAAGRDQCIRLLQLAHKYEISSIEQQLVSALADGLKDVSVSASRTLELMQLAHELKLSNLVQIGADILKERLEQAYAVSDSDDFLTDLTSLLSSPTLDPALASCACRSVLPLLTDKLSKCQAELTKTKRQLEECKAQVRQAPANDSTQQAQPKEVVGKGTAVRASVNLKPGQLPTARGGAAGKRGAFV